MFDNLPRHQGKKLLSPLFACLFLFVTSLLFLPAELPAQVLAAAKQDGKWGFIDTTGNWVVENRLDSIEVDPLRRFTKWDGTSWLSFYDRHYPQRSYFNGVTRIQKNKRWGVMDPEGNLIVPTQFDSIESQATAFSTNNYAPKVFRVMKLGKNNKPYWGLLSTTGDILVYYNHDLIEPFENGLAWVRKGKTWGQVNSEGIVVVPFQLESHGSADSYFRGYAIVDQNGKKGLLTQRGGIVMPFEYEDLNYPVDGWISFKQMGRWGVADINGNVVIEASYEELEYQTKNYFRVKRQGKWGLIHTNQQLVLPCRYEKVRYTGRQLIWAQQDGLWGAFDLRGNQKQEFKIDYFEACEAGMYLVQRNSRWGLISDHGYLVQDYVHQHIGCAENGYAGIRRDGKRGLINRQGRLIVPVEYDSIQPPKGQTVWVEVLNRWGAFDTLGQLLFPTRFDRQHFIGGRITLVREQGRYGVVDVVTGSQIVECNYEKYDTLPSGRLRLIGSQHDLLIDTRARILISERWGKIEPLGRRTDLYKVFRNQYGLVDTSGRQVVPFQYDSISYDTTSSRYVPVKYRGGWGVLDIKTAKMAVPAAYRNVHLVSDRYAAGQNAEGWQVLSLRTGLPAFAGVFEQVGYSRGPYIGISRNKLWGLVDTTGAERVKTQYGAVRPLTNKWIAVQSEKEKRWGILDETGKLVLRMEIEHLPELRGEFIWFWFQGQERVLDTQGQYDLAIARPLNYGCVAVWKEPNWMLIRQGRPLEKPLLFRELKPFYSVFDEPGTGLKPVSDTLQPPVEK